MERMDDINKEIKGNEKMEDINKKLLSSCHWDDVKKVQEYLDLEGNVNYKDDQGKTALHYAAASGDSHKVKLLVENGSIPNQKNKQGRTALHIAVDIQFANKYIIKTLLQNGCRPDIKDHQGMTPYTLLEANTRKNGQEGSEPAMKVLKEYTEYYELGLPLEVKDLDKKSANIFASLMVEEGYEHYEARVMLVGEQGTGKTTIARYLIGKAPTRFRRSTDGIGLYNGLSFIDREAEEWMHGKQDYTLLEVTFSRVLRQNGTESPENGDYLKDQDSTTDKHKYPMLTTENNTLGTDNSLHCNSPIQCMSTKVQFTSYNLKYDEIDSAPMSVLPAIDEQTEDDHIVISKKRDQLPRQQNQDRYSSNVEDGLLTLNEVEDELSAQQASKEQSAIVPEKSTEVRENFVPTKEIEEISHSESSIKKSSRKNESIPVNIIGTGMPSDKETHDHTEVKFGNRSSEATEYIETKEHVTLHDSVHHSNDGTVACLPHVGGKNLGDESSIISSKHDALPVQSEKRQLEDNEPVPILRRLPFFAMFLSVCFRLLTFEWILGIFGVFRKDDNQPLTNSRKIEKKKTEIKPPVQPSPVITTGANDRTFKTGNKIISPSVDMLDGHVITTLESLSSGEAEETCNHADFTISEVLIKQTSRQREEISSSLKDKCTPSYQEIRAHGEKKNENISSNAIESMEQVTVNELMDDDKDATVVDSLPGDEKLLGTEYLITKAKHDELPTQNEQLKFETGKSNNDAAQNFTNGINFEEKHIDIIALPCHSTDSNEEPFESGDELITPSKVLSETRSEIFEEQVIKENEAFDLVKLKEEYSHPEELHSGTEIKSQESNITTKVVKNRDAIRKLKKIFGVKKTVKKINVSMTKERFLEESHKAGKKKLHQKKIAPVIIWDFGGQDVFYSTHQTFLTYRAIYLLVLDGSRKLDDPCPSEQYLPGKSEHKTARDYLKFWINTIVTYCKGSGPGFPKIVIVLTHKDKLKARDVELRRQELFNDIEEMFSESQLLSHLVIQDKFFVNAKDKHDQEMIKIKKIITEQAMKQPTWGQKLPKCFIPLELEFDSLVHVNVPLITMEHMKMINADQPVRPLTEDELKVFLKFQHSVGRILYFDEANLDQHIILAPTHLIDAFKSIVTDRRFCAGDRLREESWDLMGKKGVIGKESITKIWMKNKYKKFKEHDEYLLGVMTHLDILVEPKRYDTLHKRIPAEFYYVASMVRTTNTTDFFELPNFAQRNIAIALSTSSLMIPPALSFRFVSYCLSLFAVKKYGKKNDEMLFHRSAVFTIDPSLDMCVNFDDEIIVVRLVHVKSRTLIMRDLASSIRECLAVSLEKISQLYVKTSSTESVTSKASFNLSLCCSSPVDPCLLTMCELQERDDSWICPKHGIEHTKDVLSSWDLQKEEIQCGVACPATDTDFLNQLPTDMHLRRLSMQYNVHETKELAIHLGMQYSTWEGLYDTIGEPERLNFETLRKCVDQYTITFNDIRKAVERGNIQNPHSLCKVVRGQLMDFDQEPEKWNLIPSDEHFDKLAPLVGNNSLAFLVELGMEFATWEQIRFKQNERDLVKLNRDILQEWKTELCNSNNIRPSLRHIGQAFNNIGKNIKLVENALADFF